MEAPQSDAFEGIAIEGLSILLEGKLDLTDPHTRNFATCCGRYVTADVKANALVLDKRAMLCAAISVGGLGGEPPPPEAQMLYRSLGQLQRFLAFKATDLSELSGDWAKKGVVVLSGSVRSAILPHAITLAARTSRTKLPQLRHVIVTLLDKTIEEAGRLTTPPLSAREVRAVQRAVVDAILAAYPDDDATAWRAFRPPASEPADEALDALIRKPPASDTIDGAPRESLPTHGDHPATIDSLGREVFASVLAQRLRAAQREAREVDGFGAFIAHIHGPWGYGKTSVLNFMRKELTKKGDPWLVVDFNAWKHNRLRPPWWSLIKAIYDAAGSGAVDGGWKRWRVWTGWKLRADWLPLAIVGVFGAIGITSALNTADATLKLVSSLVTAGAAVFAAMRVLSFGSAKAAETYAQLKTDPYQPIIKLYGELIESIGRPVAIFIDDLDRCDASYVVDLIEGIQTLLRDEPVVFVIAADRKWICSAFEKKYADFAGPIGEPARPLGYLFLDKMFQISAALPTLSRDAREGYWKTLLVGAEAGTDPPITAEAAAAMVKDIGSIKGLQQVIEDAPLAHRPAIRAAAAIEITRAENAEAIEHSLQPFADLLEANPRAMKRLVNAVGMAQARAFLEARDVPLDTLARWTMIELRWPLLADYFTSNIDAIEGVGKDEAALAGTGIPSIVVAMMSDRSLSTIIGSADARALDAERLRPLLA